MQGVCLLEVFKHLPCIYKHDSAFLLTEVIVSEHLLDLLSDGVGVELRRHGHHFLYAETGGCEVGQRQRVTGLRALRRLSGWGRLGNGCLCAAERFAAALHGLLGRAERRLRGRTAAA